ncbi:DinB family protein [Ideonella sp.]|uniref:DinB family protein n=1 Tax=Ideonella sp. TaxID=1929293 RepID=UPI0035B408CA
MTPQMAVLLAAYNRTMNERVFRAARDVSPADLRADKGAFFGSILGTLNHIAVADTIWLHRFAQYPGGFSALAALSAFERPTSLRQTVSSELEGLGDYRRRVDDIIERWVDELTPVHLASTLAYANMAGVTANKPLGAVLQHFFNHQTHHRGQVSTLLFQAGVDVGVTDLITFIPDVPPSGD